MSDDRSFFVDPSGSSSAIPTITAPHPASVLGFVERVCANCGREWQMNRGECDCGSHELIERLHEPTLLERVGGAIRSVVMPPPEKVKPADPADTAALRALAAAGRAYADALVAADQAARRIVRAGQGTSETTGYVQAKLVIAVDTVSDFAMFNLGQLYKPVLGISGMIETALAQLEQEVNAR
jgi:hypothetical protein